MEIKLKLKALVKATENLTKEKLISRRPQNYKTQFPICAYFSNNHRLGINRPTKRGKEKSPSYGHCQCEKEMDDHLLACQQIFERMPHSDLFG
jgi:hypothetical protein